ncbi:MAG: T9SS type A sorting domain-containing protein, partial [Bacteroidales bacterium]|nr:T9SS type A sorting domain-containing protein [Bacteroidales bacterium]
MYKNLCLVVGLLLFGNIQAQTVSLTFTGRDSVNKCVQLNKVVVTNLTKSWQETIYWPDTVLTLTNKTGISDVQEQEMGLFSYPNPFNGTSSVLLTIPQSQEVYMAVYNITGQRVMEFSSQLEAGTNHFDIGFQKPQVYFLVVNTLEGRMVQKLVNVGHSGDNYIKFRSTLPLSEEQTSKTQKLQSSQPFSYGDMMEYVGYATINGNMEESQRITQAQGTSQTFILQFDVTKATLPILNTYTASNITTTSAVSGGKITSDGGSSVTTRGVCWSTSPNPTINNSHTSDGSGTGSFSSNITGLTAGRTYYVRAYATNVAGTAYGAQISFTTKTTPTLTTITASNITATSAVSGGNITSDGGSSVTDRGVCWSTSPNPTINNNHTSNGSGTGSFTSNITGLTAGRTYYIRAYATNSAGTAYGDQVSFTTKTIPTLTTITASNITDNSAVSGGNITSDGGSSVTARGVCWSTSQNPTINDSHTTDGSGIGTYTSNLNNLRGNTMYYIRAYATNSIGTAYGNQVSFITNAVVPTLTTIAVNNITDTSAVSGGHITSDGGTMVTARGVCWDTTSNPTINGNHTIDGSDTGIFTSNIVGLVYGTKYYVRAYATNSVGTAYGDQLSYTTKTIPTLTTIEASKITDTTIVSGGNITSDGGYAVTARGVCWSTLPNPTINDNHTINGSGIGSYTSNIVGLNTDTLYYVRAFATNVIGTAYGNEIVVIAKAERSALFSISAYEKAIFSPGNLQWSATNGGNIATTHAVAGNSTAEGTWRFAPNQWDTIGVNNKNISSTYTGWIDLFGWSTSGFNNKYPYLKTTITQKIVTDGGSSYGNIQGTYFDWGFYNAIYNPRTNTTYDPCVWFSLTEYSWDYLLNTRNTTSGIRYAKANVHGVNGLIIVPDNWNDSVYSLNNTNTASAAYTSNIISATDWARMETLSGCVFLPATGYRDSSYFGNIYGVGSSGYYWSSTHYNARAAYVMNLSSSNLNTSSRDGKGKGYAVRLVRSALPRITTIAVSNITDTTAVCGGNIIDEGISPITDYGICWSTSKNPTVNDNHISEGKNRESYLSNMIGLIPNTTYYVRAYATNSYGTGYGGMVSFTTAQFSVSATQKVLFSPGNLQWSATNGDNNVDIIHRVADSKAAKGIWRFAPHQWDTIGAYNRNISSTYSGWIDLFGWGTSGYDDKYPYKIRGYDTTYGNGSNNISGTNYDWGLYNAIYNPSTTTTENPGAWRTLTKDEWAYLLNTRSTTSGIRYAKAKVHGVAGLIIVPDNWNVSIYSLNNTRFRTTL